LSEGPRAEVGEELIVVWRSKLTKLARRIESISLVVMAGFSKTRKKFLRF